MTRNIAGPGYIALASLTPAQITFIKSLPKAELHAHLNGCIPLSCLQELARLAVPDPSQSVAIREVLERLQKSAQFNDIDEVFQLFPAIYALTSTPEAVAFAARAVLKNFLEGEDRQCSYLELRTTPRRTKHMSRLEYLEAVLSEIEKYPADEAALIVSIDRGMSVEEVQECVDTAIGLKRRGRRVVGIDLCGDPKKGDTKQFAGAFKKAKEAGLGVTLHIAEVEALSSAAESAELLSFMPDRLGHATYLDDEAKKIVIENNICVEICLSSNILDKTVKSLPDHHLLYYFNLKHSVAISTDDTLPFQNSILGEYALLLAAPPHGLGMQEDDIIRLAGMSMKNRFTKSMRALLTLCDQISPF